jgi:hypothetical protein
MPLADHRADHYHDGHVGTSTNHTHEAVVMAKRKRPKSNNYEGIREWLRYQPEKDRAELRTALAELRKLYRKPRHNDFRWLHDVGLQVVAFFPKGKRRYGDNVIELLANHLEPDREETDKALLIRLYHARNFAITCKSSKEAGMLTDARNEKGDPLTALHVLALVSVKDNDQRAMFRKRCLKECWSGQRLRREIQNEIGRKRSYGGRKPNPPERQSPGVALRNLSLMSRQWKRSHEVWFEKPHPGLGKIRKQDCSEAVLREMEAAIEGLEQVGRAAREGLTQLKGMRQDLKTRLKTQAHG